MLNKSFDEQVENLLQKQYAQAAGLTERAFMQHLEPLRACVGELIWEDTGEQAPIPFVIVIRSELLAADKAMQLVERSDKKGFTVLEADDLRKFEALESLQIPSALAYLLIDVDTGQATRNRSPDEALKIIKDENRSPLTIAEGIALVTHYPDVLKKNNGFSLLGSRCGDRRVTALWISSGQPKLGWCWAGNPHTWLGSASCGRRIGP